MSELLMAVGVLCAMNVGLALLLVLADALIVDTSDRRITINDSKTVVVPGGQPLLAALKDQRIFIPSACGGRGSCGLCKVAVLEGGGPLLPTETPWLTPEEQQAHIRLSCQVKVRRDLRIRIPEELFNVRQYQTEVIGLADLTHDIKQVTLKLVDPPALCFTAGQFIQIARSSASPAARAWRRSGPYCSIWPAPGTPGRAGISSAPAPRATSS
jgi:Na+-transporting NADH:ubiquinone oxidoreductase subunit F